VIRDPVDENRNLAKAISVESFARLVLASRAYLRRPSLQFFTGRRRLVRRPLLQRVIALRFDHQELSEDTLWGELKRTTKHLIRHSETQGYHFIRAAAVSDNGTRSAILLLPESEALPDLEERMGPHVSLGAESAAFIEKNRSRSQLIWVGQDGRLRSLQRRRYTRLADLLADIVGGDISKLGASKEVAEAISNTGRVIKGEKLVREARKQEWMERGLREIIADTLGTDRS
jgi:tRNA nucleotidyltransferase (CCA-adding enzyme)